jgi:phosphocarrier protein HPr
VNDESSSGSNSSRLLNIINTRGLHARASAKFVQLAEKFDAEITVSKDGNSVPGTSIMGLMMLAAAPGCCILIEASGKDAIAALDALETLVKDGFGERD